MRNDIIPRGSRTSLLMVIAFFGIFVYGLLAALPGSVLPTLERNRFLPSDSEVGTFLLINAVGAVLAYLVSGPIIDRLGNKFALTLGSALVIVSMLGLVLVVTKRSTGSLTLIFGCSLLLGLGANAIVASGHSLVADVAGSWRNSALNLLDICFGLGLASLPLVVQSLQKRGGLALIFWVLGATSLLLLLLVMISKFPRSHHSAKSGAGSAADLLRSPSFLLLGIALFMYVGVEVSVGKWVVSFMERDPRILASYNIDANRLASITQMSPESLTRFFETDPLGFVIAKYALTTLTLFAVALLLGRLVSSFLLGVVKINSLILMTAGSLISTVALIVSFTAGTQGLVRMGLVAAGFGMGPIFPTSVGLASTMMPRIAGTAMSLVMGIGFAGLLVIPPAVGYVSNAAGGASGDVRTGLVAVIAASCVMWILHVLLCIRDRREFAR